MSKFIKISTIGNALHNSAPNRSYSQLVDDMILFWQEQFDNVLPEHPDLIVVSEVCDTYFDQSPSAKLEYYAERGDKVQTFYQDIARRNSCFLTYPAIRRHDGTWRNSVQLIDNTGCIIGAYDKNHPTIREVEQDGRVAGNDAPVFDTPLGKIGCVICFDLNFDELKLQYKQKKPDLLLFCSAYHGGLDQQSWAYACRAHFVGACASLPSAIISPLGTILATTTNYTGYVTTTVNLDCAVVHFDYHFDKLKALKRKYGADVTITDPGLLGAILVTSEHDTLSVNDMLAEFEIETLDNYLNRSRATQVLSRERTH